MADSGNKPIISRRLTAPVRWVWRQIVRLAGAYREDLRWLLPMLRWAVPGVVVVVGLLWLPFDLMPLDRMREWVWEGDAQEFRNALWGISAVVGVLLAMVGILLNYVRTRAIDKQARTAEGRLAAEEEGRKTERYVRAVELLGHKEIALRLGALYSLERLAKDSPPDQPAIIETIAAYVREQVPWQGPEDATAETEKPIGTPKVREDIAAALTIIFRRDRNADRDAPNPDGTGLIDLCNTDLAGLDMPDTQLDGVELDDSNLEKANFMQADLTSASFNGANLKGANLAGVSFGMAHLINANLQEALLWKAAFDHAFVRGAKLADANLTGADLAASIGLTQKQLADVIYGEHDPPSLPERLSLPTQEHNVRQPRPVSEVYE